MNVYIYNERPLLDRRIASIRWYKWYNYYSGKTAGIF